MQLTEALPNTNANAGGFKQVFKGVILRGLDWYMGSETISGRVFSHSGVAARTRELIAVEGMDPLTAFFKAGEERNGTNFGLIEKANYLKRGLSGVLLESAFRVLNQINPVLGTRAATLYSNLHTTSTQQESGDPSTGYRTVGW